VRPIDVEWRYYDTGRAVPTKVQAKTTAVLLKHRQDRRPHTRVEAVPVRQQNGWAIAAKIVKNSMFAVRAVEKVHRRRE
jgi:hypothetical protein